MVRTQIIFAIVVTLFVWTLMSNVFGGFTTLLMMGR
jgi:hypothetical protein